VWWSIPREAEGETVAILASGPSMSQAVADKVRHLRCIVINSTHRLAPWAWMLYAADGEFWCHPDTQDAQQFAGLRVSLSEAPGVHRMRNAGLIGWDEAPDCLHTYSNSGAQALQIAVKAGAKRVLLCGFDMHRYNGDHWHGKHPAGLRNTDDAHYTQFVQRFGELAKRIPTGVEIVNCTAGSALTCFPMADLDACVR
jgi:hypothetical protein